ncbi:MAG: hypothetical protein JWN32_999 [Solirubrobacterales bacterium]|nr:hypothetical protein [Solirubrobacterales bacterium]
MTADTDAAARERLRPLDRRELGGDCVVFTARRFAERSRGLARLDALPPGWGLHILRCRSVHTFAMRFPLDLIWLGADGAVVEVTRDVKPRRAATCLRARTVVEVNAGEADRFLAAGLGA